MLNRRPMLQHLLDGELESLRRADELLESSIAAELRLLNERAAVLASEASDGADDPFMDHLADEYQRIAGELATIMRSALLLRAYAALEHFLIALCTVYAAQHGLALTSADTRKYNIDKARKFLKTQVGVAFPDQSADWQELMLFCQLRNLFAHRGGRLNLSEVNGPVGKYIKKQPKLHFEGMSRAEIDAGYLPHIVNLIGKLFAQL